MKRPETTSLPSSHSPDLDASDAEGLLQAADQSLYEAKRMSRNRISLADGTPGPRVTPIPTRRRARPSAVLR